MDIREFLHDAITVAVAACAEEIRITSNQEEGTIFETYSPDKLIVKGVANEYIPGFDGVFGIPEVKMLLEIINDSNFKSDDTKISLIKDKRSVNDTIKEIISDIEFSSKKVNLKYRLTFDKGLKGQYYKYPAVKPDIACMLNIDDLKTVGMMRLVSDTFIPYNEGKSLYFKFGNSATGSSSNFLISEETVGIGLTQEFKYKVDTLIQMCGAIIKADKNAKITLSFLYRGIMILHSDMKLFKLDILRTGASE